MKELILEVLVEAMKADPLVFLLALTVDILFGEPSRAIHPVVMLGRTADMLISVTQRSRSEVVKKLWGFALILWGVIFLFGMYLTGYLIAKASGVKEILLIYNALFLKTTFALRSLVEHSEAVILSFREGDIEKARKETSKLVSRKTESLGKPHLISATVESVAENTVDSFISPLFAYALFGIFGSILYRVINTLDAMVGYKDEKHIHIGFAPARSDDIANFLPARIGVVFILIGAALAGFSVKDAVRTLLKFRKTTPSPNSYIPISLFSGALRIKLEKVGFYSIGDFDLPTSEETIAMANRISLNCCLIYSIFILLLTI